MPLTSRSISDVLRVFLSDCIGSGNQITILRELLPANLHIRPYRAFVLCFVKKNTDNVTASVNNKYHWHACFEHTKLQSQGRHFTRIHDMGIYMSCLLFHNSYTMPTFAHCGVDFCVISMQSGLLPTTCYHQTAFIGTVISLW